MCDFLKQHWLKILCGVLLILCILLSINCYLLATKEFQYPEIVFEAITCKLFEEDVHKYEYPGIVAAYWENNHVVVDVYKENKQLQEIVTYLTETYGDLVCINIADDYPQPY